MRILAGGWKSFEASVLKGKYTAEYKYELQKMFYLGAIAALGEVLNKGADAYAVHKEACDWMQRQLPNGRKDKI